MTGEPLDGPDAYRHAPSDLVADPLADVLVALADRLASVSADLRAVAARLHWAERAEPQP